MCVCGVGTKLPFPGSQCNCSKISSAELKQTLHHTSKAMSLLGEGQVARPGSLWVTAISDSPEAPCEFLM